MNHLLEEIDFEETLRLAVYDAMVSMTVVEVGLAPYATLDDPEVNGTTYDVGQPFAKTVDLDAWVHDMTAERYEECAFAGHRHRLRYDYVMESGLYENTDGLQPSSKNFVESQEDKVETISRGERKWDDDEVYDMVDLWSMWLPQEGIMGTFVHGEPERRPLQRMDWDGPERGPFHILGFTSIPGQVVPLAPVSMWIDMHRLVNKLYRKLERQADRQKTVGVYESGIEDDAERITKSSDGDMIRVDSVDRVGEKKFGGPDQVTLAMLLQVVNQFRWYSGNLDLLGGLGPQSETLGQDQLLAQSASKRMEDMSSRVYRFTRRVVEDLAQYLWTDPLIDMPLTKRVKDIDVPVRFNPEMREGDFIQYNIAIEPYSLQYQSPKAKAQSMMQIAQTVLIPMASQLAEQGVMFNLQAWLKSLAKLTNLEAEYADVLVETEPTQQGQGGPVRPPMPSQTTRKYERVSRASGAGQENATMQALLADKVPERQE